MAPIVEIRNLTKTYGNFYAVQDLSLEIEAGAIFGFIGPNGAGKTTTMRVLSTLLEPTSGQAWVGGEPVTGNPAAVRAKIGYMPDFFGVYDNMKVWEYLDFFAAAYNIAPEQRRQTIDDLLTLVDLGTKRENFVDELSRGMKQRLGLARTLVHDPDLLILDEPASGLDPRARIELRELLKELRQLGKTIMISSHILTELAELCTHIGIIERGKLLVSGEVTEILRRLQPTRAVQVRVLGRSRQAMEILSKLPGVQRVDWVPPNAVTVSPGQMANVPAPLPTVPLPNYQQQGYPPPQQGYAPPPPQGYPPQQPMYPPAQQGYPPMQPAPQYPPNIGMGQPYQTSPMIEPAQIPEGPGVLRVRVTGDDNVMSSMLVQLVRGEVPVFSFSEEVSDLEDIFLRITRGLVQ